MRLYRGESPDFTMGGIEAEARLKDVLNSEPKYTDIPGLCKAATLSEIEAQARDLEAVRAKNVAGILEG